VTLNQIDRKCRLRHLAFTIGMTFQVSDISFASSALRATALRHTLLSYLFGTVIIAVAIDIEAGLAT